MSIKVLARNAAAVLGGVALLTLFGSNACAQQSTESTEKSQKLELKFDLSKCEPMGPNLYKCPAIDKPICTEEFSQPDVVCIRVGKKGNVFVMRPGGASD
jgi:hypothetical protein